MKPVSRTAFYCAGIRAWDASRARPICGDQLAARCMTPAGAAFLDWLTTLVEGGSPGDVECTECGAPS